MTTDNNPENIANNNHHEAEILATEVRSMVRQLVRRLRMEASVDGLSWSQGSIISRLDQVGGLSSAELARAEGVRPQSITPIVAALESEGLIQSNPDPKDGRRIVLTLTEAGLKAREEGRQLKQRWLSALLEDFTAQERQELQRGVELLKRVIQ